MLLRTCSGALAAMVMTSICAPDAAAQPPPAPAEPAEAEPEEAEPEEAEPEEAEPEEEPERPVPDAPAEPPGREAAPASADPPAEEVAAGAAGAGTEPEISEAKAEPPQPAIASDAKRAVPDYDGRGEEPLTAGDVLIWIPRGVFFPLYVITEYGLRRPLGEITIFVEEEDIPKKLADFFTFGPGGKSGLVPSFLIDFGFRPSIGLYFFSDDTLWEGSGIRSHVAFGGIDWYRATLGLRHRLHDETVEHPEKFVQAKFTFDRRPDWLFWGLGADSVEDHETRYLAQRIEGDAIFDGGFWRSSRLRAELGVRDVRFGDDSCCDDLPLREGVAQGFFPLPPHFDDGYLIFRGAVDGAIDTRERRFAFEGDASDHVAPSGSGVKLAARGELGAGLRESDLVESGAVRSERPLYIKYGASLGGYLDIYNQRTVGLQVIADFIDPLGDSTLVPFYELISLGGSRPMRGFLERRLLGLSSAVAQLEYSWPIWVFLDGAMHYAVGNVFDEHLENFAADKLRQSVGIGFKGTGSRDHAFELLLAFGTETFEQGSGLDTVRFVFGASEGF